MVCLSYIFLLGLYPLFSSGTPLGTPVRPQQPHQPRQSTTSCTPNYSTCPAAPCSAIQFRTSSNENGRLNCIYTNDDITEGDACVYNTSTGTLEAAESNQQIPDCLCIDRAVDSNNCPTTRKRSSLEILGAKRESYDPALWSSKRTPFTGRRDDA